MVDPQLDGIKEPTARLAVITQNLYSTCYERVTRGVLHQVCDIPYTEKFSFAQIRIAWYLHSCSQGSILELLREKHRWTRSSR